MSTYFHSELLIWDFGISCAFREHVITIYQGLPYALPYMKPCFNGNYALFLLITRFNSLPEVLLNVLQYIFRKISTKISIFQRITRRYHQFFQKNINILSLKKTRW